MLDSTMNSLHIRLPEGSLKSIKENNMSYSPLEVKSKTELTIINNDQINKNETQKDHDTDNVEQNDKRNEQENVDEFLLEKNETNNIKNNQIDKNINDKKSNDVITVNKDLDKIDEILNYDPKNDKINIIPDTFLSSANKINCPIDRQNNQREGEVPGRIRNKNDSDLKHNYDYNINQQQQSQYSYNAPVQPTSRNLEAIYLFGYSSPHNPKYMNNDSNNDNNNYNTNGNNQYNNKYSYNNQNDFDRNNNIHYDNNNQDINMNRSNNSNTRIISNTNRSVYPSPSAPPTHTSPFKEVSRSLHPFPLLTEPSPLQLNRNICNIKEGQYNKINNQQHQQLHHQKDISNIDQSNMQYDYSHNKENMNVFIPQSVPGYPPPKFPREGSALRALREENSQAPSSQLNINKELYTDKYYKEQLKNTNDYYGNIYNSSNDRNIYVNMSPLPLSSSSIYDRQEYLNNMKLIREKLITSN